MIKFFRKIRQRLLTENKFSKYILYAIGEIVLVMIGILLALQVNNSNELRKSKVQEIEILKGIKQDLVNDTTDISYNVRGYEVYIELDSLILSHFYNKKNFNKLVLDYFTYGVTANWFVELHSSYFEELKAKGLSEISNRVLKDKISRLYQFDYPYYEKSENSRRHYDHRFLTTAGLDKYFKIDSTGFTMDSQTYNNLLLDGHAHYIIDQSMTMKKKLLRNSTALLLKNAELRGLIESEIEHLEK